MMFRLMLISCSNLKSSVLEMIPAIDRYQGVIYRVIKKARRDGYWPKNTDIFIVSAKYGLISEYFLIEPYDQKMVACRAIEIQLEVSSALDIILKTKHYNNIFINMGKFYMQCLRFSYEIAQARKAGIVQEASSGIGLRQKQTKTWIIDQYALDLKTLC